MRIWIAHLISNSNAHVDFNAYTAEAAAGLNDKLAEAVRSGEMEEARGIAHEIKVYKDLKKAVTREVNEQRSQTDYLNVVKGN